MTKNIFTMFVFTLVLFLVPSLVFAAEKSQTPSSILREIRTEQKINSNQNINCDAVSDDTWEELGDAVMSERHPDQDEHEFMDEMMGGEGSVSLAYMEINMGKGYAGCGYESGLDYWNAGRMMGGNGMMGWGYSLPSKGVLSADEPATIWSFLATFFIPVMIALFAFLSFVILVVVLLMMRGNKKKK